MEFVYVLTSEYINYCKIGLTCNPASLNGRYSTSFGGTQTIRLFRTGDCRQVERLLHWGFAKYCIGGECFAKSSEVDYTAEVSRLLGEHPLSPSEASDLIQPPKTCSEGATQTDATYATEPSQAWVCDSVHGDVIAEMAQFVLKHQAQQAVVRPVEQPRRARSSREQIKDWLQARLDFDPPRPVHTGYRTINHCGLLLSDLNARCKRELGGLKLPPREMKAQIVAVMEQLGKPYFARGRPASICGKSVKSVFVNVAFK